MNKQFLFFGLTACIFSVSAFAGDNGFVENTTDMDKQYSIYTQSMKGLDIAKDKNEIYYRLSQMSFTNHMMYQRYLIEKSQSVNKSGAVRDAWCLDAKYDRSFYKQLSDIVASILTNRDASKMEEIEVSTGKFKIVKGTNIRDLSVAELNYTILYNFVDKHLLKLLDKDKIKEPLKEGDFKSKWYHWDDDQANFGIAQEQLLLFRYVTDTYGNDAEYSEICSRLNKAKDDCVRYVYASQLHQYITIQNVLTYRARQLGGIEEGFSGIANYKYNPKNDNDFRLFNNYGDYKIEIASTQAVSSKEEDKEYYEHIAPVKVVDSLEGNDQEIAELLNGASFIQNYVGVKSLQATTYATPYATITQLGSHEKEKKYQGTDLDESAEYVMNIIAGRPLSKLLTHRSPTNNYVVGSPTSIEVTKEPYYDIYFDQTKFESNSCITKVKPEDGDSFYQLYDPDTSTHTDLKGSEGEKVAKDIIISYAKTELQKGDITNKELFDISHVASVIGTYGKSITNKGGRGSALGLIELHFALKKDGTVLVDKTIENNDMTIEGKKFKTAYDKQLEKAVNKVNAYKK